MALAALGGHAASSWASLGIALTSDSLNMSMADHVIRVQADLGELGEFYNIDIAPRRYEALETYHENELELLTKIDFDGLDQEGKVDYIMLQTFHTRQLNNLNLQKASQEKFYPLLPFADDLIGLLEARQDVEPMKAKETAKTLNDITKSRKFKRRLRAANSMLPRRRAILLQRLSKVFLSTLQNGSHFTRLTIPCSTFGSRRPGKLQTLR